MASSIGSLWKTKEGSKAALTGEMDLMGIRLSVCVMKNDKKELDKHPDYRIVSFGIKEDKPQQDNMNQDNGW